MVLNTLGVEVEAVSGVLDSFARSAGGGSLDRPLVGMAAIAVVVPVDIRLLLYSLALGAHVTIAASTNGVLESMRTGLSRFARSSNHARPVKLHTRAKAAYQISKGNDHPQPYEATIHFPNFSAADDGECPNRSDITSSNTHTFSDTPETFRSVQHNTLCTPDGTANG